MLKVPTEGSVSMATRPRGYVLVAWEGKSPSWSVIESSCVVGRLAIAERVKALWGKKKYHCEILTLSGNQLHYHIAYYS